MHDSKRVMSARAEQKKRRKKRMRRRCGGEYKIRDEDLQKGHVYKGTKRREEKRIGEIVKDV